ncbi:MAG: transposase [Verrucomicrobia bacterium]|nr:transposase [Verrucomicrobiota bacterium]
MNFRDYRRVLAQDSTVLKLPLALFPEFSGVSNGSSSVCSARIQAVCDLLSGQLIGFPIDPYSKNDLTAAPELEIREGDLVLRDRGYLTAAEMHSQVATKRPPPLNRRWPDIVATTKGKSAGNSRKHGRFWLNLTRIRRGFRMRRVGCAGFGWWQRHEIVGGFMGIALLRSITAHRALPRAFPAFLATRRSDAPAVPLCYQPNWQCRSLGQSAAS